MKTIKDYTRSVNIKTMHNDTYNTVLLLKNNSNSLTLSQGSPNFQNKINCFLHFIYILYYSHKKHL